MSRDKQIEEMARDLCNATQKTNQGCNSICYPRGMCAHCKVMAEHLYDAGYRKASEVAEEIADFIWEKDIAGTLLPINGRYLSKQEFLSELKKKYTESGRDKIAEFGKYSPLSWKNTEDK